MNKAAQDTGTIARSAGTVGIAVMCSRVLGLVREQAFAFLFGAGFAFDAFVVAFRIPNLLRDLFAEGALSAAFVAVFSDYDENRGTEKTWQLANTVLAFFCVVLSALVLLGIFFADEIVRFLVEADFEQVPGKVELTSKLTVIMFPFLLVVSLSSVVMGILNTKGRFFIPALAASFFNVGSLIGGIGMALIMPWFGQPAIVGMAIGTMIGGLLQLAGQLPTLLRTGFRFRWHFDLRDPGLRRILRLMVPAVIGLAPLQVNVLVNTYFASSLAEGTISWLNYAFRLFFFPVGIFGVALSTATMPVISRYAAQRDMTRLRETVVSSLIMAFCLTIPASVGLIMLAEPIVRLVYQYGRFDAFTTMRTAEVLSCYALGLFAYAAVKIMVPVFYALNDTKFPVVGSFVTMILNVVIILLTVGTLHHRALALSISFAVTCNFLFLSAALYRKLEGYPLAYVAKGLAKVAAASLIMGIWLYGARHLLAGVLPATRWVEATGLLVVMATSAGLYGAALYFLRVRELTVLIDKFRRRLAA
jgi:putative peptidoglycan lipid II flippase